MALTLKTPTDHLREIAERAKARRLASNLSQAGLAQRSGVSLGSLKRFEKTGQISLDSLLKLALVLDALSDFEHLFLSGPEQIKSLDQLLKENKQRKRGRKK